MNSTLQYKATESVQSVSVQGSVVFNTASNLTEQWDQIMSELNSDSSQASLVIDCSSMDKIDSAGIALFLAWKRQVSSVFFENLPEQARSLIEAYHLQSLLKH